MSFKWPCDRREAHGPHERRCTGFDDGKPGKPKVYPTGDGMTYEKDCPGVSAHPATMIGGKHEYEREFIDTRTKIRAGAKRGKARMLTEDRHGRPIDFDYWYKYNSQYKAFVWPDTVEQEIPCNLRHMTHVGLVVNLTAPIGVDGARGARLYRVESIKGDRALFQRVS